MQRITKRAMEIIRHFAEKHGLDPQKVRKEMDKALSTTSLRGICDAEFFLETIVFMLAKELKRKRCR